ncbi:hypothetical protein SALBM135S_02853 [Streptomyces alboniger]
MHAPGRTTRNPPAHRHRRSPGEQPQGGGPAHSEGPAHGLHRGLGLGQVVGRLRHDRGREPTAAQRDLPLVRPQPAAEVRAAARGLHRGPLARDRRRPAAGRRPLPLHRGHDDGRLLRDQGAVLPVRHTERGPRDGVLLQRPLGHVPGVRRPRQDRAARLRPHPRPRQVPGGRRDPLPAVRRGDLAGADVHQHRGLSAGAVGRVRGGAERVRLGDAGGGGRWPTTAPTRSSWRTPWWSSATSP